MWQELGVWGRAGGVARQGCIITEASPALGMGVERHM